METHGDPRTAQAIASLSCASALAANYIHQLPNRNVAPSTDAVIQLKNLDQPLPERPSDPSETLKLLNEFGSPATVASSGGRFFGLVVGATLPAALGARVLTSSWDQVVFNEVTSPAGIEIERIAGRWLLEIFGLPDACSVGFVTGATMASFTCLAAARQRLLAQMGWDVDRQGLFGAPQLRIVASEEIHVTVLKALRLLGLGTDKIEWVECDANGSILVDAIPALDAKTLVLTQVGNVNSGASDPVGSIADKANGAWIHVDGAFGLWSAASPTHRGKIKGFERADSWTVDGHKWLNTPYDCGIAICRHATAIHTSMATVAPYLSADAPDWGAAMAVAPKDMVPEFSRSARAAEIWAALHSLGKQGLADLVARNCHHAVAMANGLKGLGFEILNDVCLNQVVATLPGQEDQCAQIATNVQSSGEAWFGTTSWKGRTAIRLSFSSWRTTDADVQRTLDAIKLAIPD